MGCPCETCEKVNFQLFDNQGKEIGKVVKQGKSCVKNTIGDADNFGIDFPKSMNWEHRTLIMAGMLLIDYMMFEEKGNQNQNTNILD